MNSETKRNVVGLIIQDLGLNLFLGAAEAAKKKDVNLFCFLGEIINGPDKILNQANIAYSLVDPNRLNALAMWGGSGAAVTMFLDEAGTTDFVHKFQPLPLVNYERKIEGVPVVLTDVYQGMREAMRHLIEIHHRQKIALIWGPSGHFETEERVRAYRDTLEEYHIPINNHLISNPVLWTNEGGEQAMNELLRERGILPGVDFDALITTDSSQAAGAMQLLRQRGIHVPDDLVVLGFDERDDSRLTTPPLTVVRKPFFEVGEKLIEIANHLATGDEIPEAIHVPTQMVIRRSCGCIDPAISQASLDNTQASQEKFDLIINTRRANFMAEVASGMEAAVPHSDKSTILKIIDSFINELTGEGIGCFARLLEEYLHQEIGNVKNDAFILENTINGSAWQNMISAMQRRIVPHLDGKKRTHADILWNQARITISETTLRFQSNQAYKSSQQMQILREIEARLSTAFSLEALEKILVEGLPRLGIKSCYLSLYENPTTYEYPQPAPEWSRLIMAYTEEGPIELEKKGKRFPTRNLTPEGYLPKDRQFSYLILPLYFNQEQEGFILFEIGPQDAIIYNSLQVQIASALHGAYLVMRSEERAARLAAATEVSRTASSMINLDELIQNTVELIRECFNLYYVGLFLIDSEGQYACLRAGTGNSGRQMVSKGHRLDVGGNSMIGWCITNHKARIALNVGKESIRFDNPLLPDTRSELALPMSARGITIGALSVQSDQESAFNESDITILQSMADQLANAIDNTRLIDARQQAEINAERRAVQLQTASEISRAASSLLEVNELSQLAVNLICNRFNFYYVGLFLIDTGGEWTGEPGRWAVLRAATGEAGEKMKSQGHKLEISGASMVGWCVANNSIRITLETNIDTPNALDLPGSSPSIERYKNPLLPNTRSELAIPLTSRGQVLGALTIQSALPNAFSNEDIAILQSMADQLANAIANARLYEQTQNALKEMETIYRRYLARGWSEYSQSRATSGYRKNDNEVTPLGDELLPEVMRTLQEPQPSLVKIPELEQTLVVPIKLRDNPIGVIGLRTATDQRQWSADDISLIETLSEQFALAAENIRLLDETQRRAEREHIVSEITSKIRASNDPQVILQTATSELLRALKAKNAHVLIEPIDEPVSGRDILNATGNTVVENRGTS